MACRRLAPKLWRGGGRWMSSARIRSTGLTPVMMGIYKAQRSVHTHAIQIYHPFGYRSNERLKCSKEYVFYGYFNLSMRWWKSAVLCEDTSGRAEESTGLSDNSEGTTLWKQICVVVTRAGRISWWQSWSRAGPTPGAQSQPRPESVSVEGEHWALVSISSRHPWADTGERAALAAPPASGTGYFSTGLCLCGPRLLWMMPKLSSYAETVKTCEPTNHAVKVNYIYQSGQQMFVNISAASSHTMAMSKLTHWILFQTEELVK